MRPEDALHVGDDRRNDVWGARDAGCDAWLWGSDVHSFKEVYLLPLICIKAIRLLWLCRFYKTKVDMLVFCYVDVCRLQKELE